MNLYSYLENNRIVFSCEAEDILKADGKCKEAGFNPMKTTCRIGISLVLHQSVSIIPLFKEKITNSGIKFPEIFIKREQVIFFGDSKEKLVEKNEHKIYSTPFENLFWKRADGFAEPDKGQLNRYLQQLKAARIPARKEKHHDSI